MRSPKNEEQEINRAEGRANRRDQKKKPKMKVSGRGMKKFAQTKKPRK
jgi:hypothetical protein